MMTEKKQWTLDEVKSLMEKAVAEMRGVSLESVERCGGVSDNYIATIKGYLNLSELIIIARAIGDAHLAIIADDDNKISLDFQPSESKSD